MSNFELVQVLLATFNGEQYIREQIMSLLKQTHSNIEIIIRDDGSTDLTVEIVQEMARQYPGKIRIISDGVKSGSAQGNFMRLLKCADAQYVMFCDQDDVWFENKIERTLKQMQAYENRDSLEVIPTLVFSDYIATDKKLTPLKLNKKSMQIYKGYTELNRLVVQNYITGCTVMVNRELYTKVQEPSKGTILMHDWWVAICAAAFGQIIHIKKPLMYYRQHDNNVVGAVDITSLSYIGSKMLDARTKLSMQIYVEQIESFLETEKQYITNKKNRELLEKFIDIPNHKKLKRMIMLFQGKYYKSTAIRTIGEFFYV